VGGAGGDIPTAGWANVCGKLIRARGRTLQARRISSHTAEVLAPRSFPRGGSGVFRAQEN
jgi:hypothetical protein